MEKHPFTFTIIIAVLAAFLGQFGGRGLDAMSNFIIHEGWCSKDGATCLFLYQFAVLLAIFMIGLYIDATISRKRDWTEVDFLQWYPSSQEVIGGIVLHNNSWVNLDDCIAELTGYEDDEQVSLGLSSFGVFLKNRGDLPKKLLWQINSKPEEIAKIGRGKEAHLMITFPIEDRDQVVVGKKLMYKIITDGLGFLEPFQKGWLYIRISAQVNGTPLPLMKIGVRLEMEENVPIFKEIKKLTNKNFSIFGKNTSGNAT